MNNIYAVVQKLNPAAKILKTKYSKVDPKDVMGTGLFDFEKASFHAGWLKELRGEHVPESDEYGISSFVLRDRRPMSSARFEQLLSSKILKNENVIRAKGTLWLDCCENAITVFDLAGASIEVNAEQEWFVEMKNNEPEMWESFAPSYKEAILQDFEGEQGDKRQEFVFIGKDMDEAKVRKAIESCLLTDEELKQGKDVWSDVPNPFMTWNDEEEEEIEGDEFDNHQKPEVDEAAEEKRI